MGFGRTRREFTALSSSGRRFAVSGCGVVVLVASLMIGSAGRATPPASPASPSTAHFVIDPATGQRAISPLIYGINGNVIPNGNGTSGWPQSTTQPDFAQVLAATRATLVRQGGDSLTDFNWEIGDSNHGSDYDYSNYPFIPDGATSVKKQHAPGKPIAMTVAAAAKDGAASLVTVPIQGYVAADELDQNTDVRDSGPDYLSTRFKQNEPIDPEPLTSTPDTSDAYVYQDQFVYFLQHAEPQADILYELDNEPNDWEYVHPEVHPNPITYAELISDDLTYAAAIKSVAPDALVLGPVLDGYQGLQDPDNGNGTSADYLKYGPFLPYYLKAIKAADAAAGKTLVDIFDLHWYPQVTPDVFNNDDTSDVVAAREQAPRSLWDPTYVENSWITQANGGKPIDLIPTIEKKIAALNPGMGLAITEWNYGGGQDISGGIASADTLGIFGKYGLEVASQWPEFSPDEDYTYGAFKVFENYNGHGARFGNTEVTATDSDTVDTSVYASIDSGDPGQVTIVAINKELTAEPTTIKVEGATSGSAAVYTLTSAGPNPRPAPGLTASRPGVFDYTMPAQSVSVIVPAA